MTVRGHGRRGGEGEEGAPNPHDNDSHEPDMAEASELDNKADDPHGNEVHTENFVTDDDVDGKADDPHGNEAHTENYLTESDLDNGDGNGVESGIIAMYSGDIANIPSGWTLCDGTDGTPDLRDVFIRGAGGEDNPMDAGGEDQVTLTESELASHDHGTEQQPHDHNSGTLTTDQHSGHNHTHQWIDSGDSAEAGSDFVPASSTDSTSQNTTSDGEHSHSISGTTGDETAHISIESTGGNEAHENKPSYVALAYIMKV